MVAYLLTRRAMTRRRKDRIVKCIVLVGAFLVVESMLYLLME